MANPEVIRFAIEQMPLLWISVCGGFPILAMAFSTAVRNRLKNRSGGYDEVTGEPITQGEGAHFNHNRNLEEYDTEDNGLFVNAITHWWMHKIDDEDNGLTDSQNTWARGKIAERMKPSEEEKKIFGRWLD
jgi:hypothetical protein